MPFQISATTMKPASLAPRLYLVRNVAGSAPRRAFVYVAPAVVGFDEVRPLNRPRPTAAKQVPAPPMIMNSSGMRPSQRSEVSPRSITASPGLAGFTQHSVRVPGLSRATIAALPRYPLDIF